MHTSDYQPHSSRPTRGREDHWDQDTHRACQQQGDGGLLKPRPARPMLVDGARPTLRPLVAECHDALPELGVRRTSRQGALPDDRGADHVGVCGPRNASCSIATCSRDLSGVTAHPEANLGHRASGIPPANTFPPAYHGQRVSSTCPRSTPAPASGVATDRRPPDR